MSVKTLLLFLIKTFLHRKYIKINLYVYLDIKYPYNFHNLITTRCISLIPDNSLGPNNWINPTSKVRAQCHVLVFGSISPRTKKKVQYCKS